MSSLTYLAIDLLLVTMTGVSRLCVFHSDVRVSRDSLEACKIS